VELKNFFAQDDAGNILSEATCYVYQRGTESLAGGLTKANGNLLDNPFSADDKGFAEFAAPNGLYDVRLVKGLRDYRIRLQFNDVAETVEAAESAAARAEIASDAAVFAAGVKDDIAHGLATTSNGENFAVLDPSLEGFVILYKNVAGTALELRRVSSEAALKQLSNFVKGTLDVQSHVSADYALAMVDAFNRMALAITKEGKVDLGNIKDVAGLLTLLSSLINTSNAYGRSGYLFALLDAFNRVAFGVTAAGDLVVKGGSVAGRLAALEQSAGQSPAYDKWINGLSSVACWGDSLTFGAGASNDSYPKALSTLLGRTVHRGAVGGQNSQQIATRQGGYVNLLTVTDNTIPASGAVNITASTQAPITSQGGGPIAGTLAGVAGSVSATFDGSGNRTAYLFTRTAAGTALIIDAATPFIPVEDDHPFEVSVFWYGRNNFWTGRTDFDNAKAEVKAALAASIAFLKPLNKKFVVMSVLNDNKEAEWIGTEKYNAITSLNEELKALYPRNFIDIRRHLVRGYNPALPQDVIDLGHDVTPTSLLSDTLHLNVAGYARVAQVVYNFIIQKGW
jgi:lysophospholipase L1-like esterase